MPLYRSNSRTPASDPIYQAALRACQLHNCEYVIWPTVPAVGPQLILQDQYTVPLGGNITRDYYLTGLEQDSIQITDRATGVSEKIKTQFSEKPTAMPVGAGAAGAGSVGTAPRSVGASPYPGGVPGSRPGGSSGSGGPAGSGGSGTTITVVPGAVPGPMGGHSVR